MWFLTVDPLVRVSVFIAKLSGRQYCWRVIEDLHIQEYIQLFDMNCGLFMRLRFSIGCYDYRRTTRLRQSIHFSRILVLFADHVHRRSGVDNRFSFSGFRFDGAGKHQFSESEKNAALFSPLIFGCV